MSALPVFKAIQFEPAGWRYSTKRRGHRQLLHRQKRRWYRAGVLMDKEFELLACASWMRQQMSEDSMMRRIFTANLPAGTAGQVEYSRSGPNKALHIFEVPEIRRGVYEDRILNRRVGLALRAIKTAAVSTTAGGWRVQLYNPHWIAKLEWLLTDLGYLVAPSV